MSIKENIQMEEVNPTTLLQSKVASVSDQLSLLEKLLKGLNNFFSKDDLDQKTIIEEINAIGMTEIETTNEFLAKYLGNDEHGEPYIDRIAQAVVERRRVNNKSVHGKGVDLMIDFVEAFSGNSQTETPESSLDKIKRIS
jgi:hypothetical protein